jgi:hypothetical protein
MMALKTIAGASFFCLAATTIAATPPLLNDPVDARRKSFVEHPAEFRELNQTSKRRRQSVP